MPRPSGAAGGRGGARRAGQLAQNFVAHCLCANTQLDQHPCSDTVVLTYQAEQNVLGTDVVVAHRVSLTET